MKQNWINVASEISTRSVFLRPAGNCGEQDPRQEHVIAFLNRLHVLSAIDNDTRAFVTKDGWKIHG